MKLTSPEFTDQARVPGRFTCEGENISPPLDWSDVPDGAAELALTCEDPDAPGGTFAHWVLWGLHPTTSGLRANTAPPGVHAGRNGFGRFGYDGPCPPPGHGTHHYYFQLSAWDAPIDLPEGASIDELHQAARGRILDEATLVGTYQR